MVPALILFALTYLLMLALPQHRPFAALGGALLFVLMVAPVGLVLARKLDVSPVPVLIAIAVSFLPRPSGGVLLTLYGLRSGLVCAGLCLFGVLRACLRRVSVPVAGVGLCGVRSFSRRLHFQTAV